MVPLDDRGLWSPVAAGDGLAEAVRGCGRPDPLSVCRGKRGMPMLIALMALAAAGAAPATCAPGAEAHRRIVDAFYREALVDKQPRAAFDKYVAPGFVEHKPDIPHGTREAAAEFLAGLMADVPAAKWEVQRIIADGDTVALHARFTPAPGAPAYAIADFFRLKDCKIVEHWDVVAGPPKEQANPNPRF